MPLYPYRCTKCGNRFEKIQSFTDAPLTECPQCGGALERPLTAPGLQFKGAGWYVTDYSKSGSSGSGDAKSSESKPIESKSSTESKGNTSDSGSTSSAPAAKSESAKS